MRKDSINNEALEKAYLIYKEHGHQIVEYDFSHAPTDYARGTVREPEQVSVVEGAFNELVNPANVSNGFRYEDLKTKEAALDKQIDEQQNKLRICRLRGNFKEFHRCMKVMQDLIKEKERLDAQIAVATPGGNAGQKQMDDYNRTYDQDHNYSEITSIAERIAALEEQIKSYMTEE